MGCSEDSTVTRTVENALDTAGEQSTQAGGGMSELALKGEQVFLKNNCNACHSVDGSEGELGPTLKGLFGREVELEMGRRAFAHEDYLRESIRQPTKKISAGWDAVMPVYGENVISERDLDALVAYLKALGNPD